MSRARPRFGLAGLLLTLLTGCSALESAIPDAPTQHASSQSDDASDNEAIESVVAGAVRGAAAALSGASMLSVEVVSLQSQWDRAWHFADRRLLTRRLAESNIEVPSGTHLVVGRIVEGHAQPAIQWFSYGDTGLVSSRERFWPASSIKLMAAVAALHTARRHGFDGRAKIELDDVYGHMRKPLRRLIRNAIIRSSNPAYNRLVLIAGLDTLNQDVFNADTGYPHVVIQRFYAEPVPEATLRESPPIHVDAGDREVELPARLAEGDYSRCPEIGNCTSLEEMLDVLFRVVAHDELPPTRRFDIAADDIRNLRSALERAPSKIEDGVRQALGEDADDVEIYNKAGRVRGLDHLDTAFVREATSGRSWLIGVSVPYADRSAEQDAITQAQLSELTREALGAVIEYDEDGPAPVQAIDGELELRTRLASSGTRSVTLELSFSPPGEVGAESPVELDLWLDTMHVATLHDLRVELRVPLEMALKTEALAVRARQNNRTVGFGAWRLKLERVPIVKRP